MKTLKVTDQGPQQRFHAVRFYESDDALVHTLADYIAQGVALDEPSLVIATPHHREALLSVLRSNGVDVDRIQAGGDLVLLDARGVLAKFTIDGFPDEERFEAVIPATIDGVRKGRASTIRAYGEMVDVLWRDGLTSAAIRLEELWNQLSSRQNFSLLCGYALESFYGNRGMRDVCAQHSHVVPAKSRLTEE
jgi:hypothetical protein